MRKASAVQPPVRGEVWLVRLPKAVGVELQRDRPAVVVSSAAFDQLAVRIAVPLTTWRFEFKGAVNKIRIVPSERNGLDAESAADFLQIRSLSVDRFVTRIGELEPRQVDEIVAGILIAVDYVP